MRAPGLDLEGMAIMGEGQSRTCRREHFYLFRNGRVGSASKLNGCSSADEHVQACLNIKSYLPVRTLSGARPAGPLRTRHTLMHQNCPAKWYNFCYHFWADRASLTRLCHLVGQFWCIGIYLSGCGPAGCAVPDTLKGVITSKVCPKRACGVVCEVRTRWTFDVANNPVPSSIENNANMVNFEGLEGVVPPKLC